MCGVDVTNQLRGSYACQVYTHTWWHRLLLFLLDTTCANMWILHKQECSWKGVPWSAHLDFQLAKASMLQL